MPLVAYNSDDDDDENEVQAMPDLGNDTNPSIVQAQESVSRQSNKAIGTSHDTPRTRSPSVNNGVPQNDIATLQLAPSPIPNAVKGGIADDGPILGPIRPRDAMEVEPEDGENDIEMPMSPYSQNRALLRSYTIPPLPLDFSIPDSPPGSPDPASVKTFSHFLKLKDQNVHFNAKLANNTNLRNPNLLDTLLNFVDLDKDVVQYASTRSKDRWVTDLDKLGQGIPRRKGETYIQALSRLQRETTEKQQKERTTVDFVGSNNESVTRQESSGTHTRSAAERIMAGLDRDSRKNTPEPRADSSRSARGRNDRDRDRRNDRKFNDDTNNGYKRARSRSTSRTRESGRYRERDYNRR